MKRVLGSIAAIALIALDLIAADSADSRAAFVDCIVLCGAQRSSDSNVTHILTMRPDGSMLADLGKLNATNVIGARVSPDGGRLAYSVPKDDEHKAELWIFEEDQTSRKLSDDAQVAAWSPDGARLVCARGERYKWVHFVIDALSGEVRELPVPKTDLVYDCSPDGKRLLVMAGNVDKYFDHPQKGRYPLRQLYLVDMDGSNQQMLTTDPALDNIWGRFSPDGKRIAHYQRRHKDGEVFESAIVRRADGSDPVVLFVFRDLDRKIVRPTRPPAWSPDGKSIAWIVSKQDRETFAILGREIVLIPVDGGVKQRIKLDSLDVAFPGWLDWR